MSSIAKGSVRTLACLIVILLFTVSSSRPRQTVDERISALERDGRFREAAALLRDSLSRARRDPERKTLEFEIDRLRRIRLDYNLTRDQLRERTFRSIQGVTEEEFGGWVRDGWFDARVIDDTLRFVGVSVSNLFMRHQELAGRRTSSRDNSDLEQRTLRAAESIRQAVMREGTPFVLPRRFRAVMTLSVDADAVPDGAVVRAWLPVPRSLPYQHGFTVTKASSPLLHLAPDTSLIRSAYLEQRAFKGKKTVFRIEYEYTRHGVWFPLDPAKVPDIVQAGPDIAPYLREGSHVVFTEKLRALSDSIVGKETNPLVKAKRIHDWISENVLYSYAREYSTIRNISDYCLTMRYGDCGQHALLYIALCRLNGIPARWQSGWYTFPGAKDIHDWTEIYLPPYGWVPVDPDMGVFAMRYYTSLSLSERRRLRDFYFGGLEQYRMSANRDHSQVLDPPKRSLRSDTVDFQRGEAEWDGGNIYFDRFSYSLRIEEVAPQEVGPVVR